VLGGLAVLGPVPKEWVIGGAFATYWPPDRIGLL
jgi:signal peptidase I